jgi:armadillo repeat-containing protein 8
VLDSNHPAEVKEQALCILGNIGAGARDKDYILEDEALLVRLLEFLVGLKSEIISLDLWKWNQIELKIDKLSYKCCFFFVKKVHKDPKLQAGSLFAIGNLLHQSGRQKKLKELGIMLHLEKMLNMTPRESQFYEE